MEDDGPRLPHHDEMMQTTLERPIVNLLAKLVLLNLEFEFLGESRISKSGYRGRWE